MNELETSYIHKISLKNYKSIRDLTIDLHPGLNIMIGQNGSGKTNFVQAIQSVLSESLHHKLPIGFEFGFEFTSPFEKSKKKWKGNIKEVNHKTIQGKKIKIYESKLGKIKRESLFHSDIVDELPSLEPLIIPFTLPNELPHLKQLETIHIGQTLFGFSFEDKFGYFEPFESESLLNDGMLQEIETHFKVNDNLKEHLKRFSPIKDFRVTSGYNIEANYYKINNVILEFFVNNNWYSWEQLSDGTKRLFYIISQTINNQSLVIIEEPEVGVHPDQLFLLMNFLSAQSKSKQIIVTTHSPDVLNTLEKNELHKIIVTRFDSERGTLMHHLSPKKMEKALRYINTEGLELKDFWVHSNLEEIDETK
jgi:predicted ATP-dependent endonuclease of OLD family